MTNAEMALSHLRQALNQIPIVLTEDRDLTDRALEGVQFINHFSPSFTLASLR